MVHQLISKIQPSLFQGTRLLQRAKLRFMESIQQQRNQSGIAISSIKKDEHEKVSKFLLDNFYRDEPMGIALGLNIDKEVRNWFPKYVQAHFERTPPISSQAIDTKTGKLVGVNFCIVIDPKSVRPPLMVDYVDPETQPIKNHICIFLDEIEEGLNAAELLGIKSLSTDEGDPEPKIMDCLMLSVHKDYCNQGLAVKLLTKSEESARKVKNCLVAKTVTTSEWSYKAFLKKDYFVIREFQHERYKNPEGIHIFMPILKELGLHKSSRVMIKDLS